MLSEELSKDTMWALRELVDGGDHETAEELLEALFDDVASIKEEAAQVEWLKAELTRLHAAVATLAGALRAFIDYDQRTHWHDSPKPPCRCRLCENGRAALAVAEPRPAGETEGGRRC
jgi:hypothetical protein